MAWWLSRFLPEWPRKWQSPGFRWGMVGGRETWPRPSWTCQIRGAFETVRGRCPVFIWMCRSSGQEQSLTGKMHFWVFVGKETSAWWSERGEQRAPEGPWKRYHLKIELRASLVAQWLGIHLPMQGTRVHAPVREDPTCRGATRPVSHNYWACASGACAPQQERPR